MTTNKEITTNNLKTALIKYTGDRLQDLKEAKELLEAINITLSIKGVKDILDQGLSQNQSSLFIIYKGDFEKFFNEEVFSSFVLDSLGILKEFFGDEDFIKKIRQCEQAEIPEVAIKYSSYLLKKLRITYPGKYKEIFLNYLEVRGRNLNIFLDDIDNFLSESFSCLIDYSSKDESNLLRLGEDREILDTDDQDHIEQTIDDTEINIFIEDVPDIIRPLYTPVS